MKPAKCFLFDYLYGEDTDIFGYTRPLQHELKIREHQCYKAYYCGICREIGHHFGQFPRFGLTHEFAVLAMLLEACAGDERSLVIKRRPCIAHPFRKVVSYQGSPFISYGAAVNVLFFQAKLQDSWQDDGNIIALLGKVFFAAGNRKARRRFKSFAEAVVKHIQELTQLETQNCASVDQVAEPFAQLLATLFTVDGLMPAEISPHLRNLGYHLGKWIYLIDAAEDRERDRKRNNYNVYNIRYGAAPLPENETLTRELSLAAVAESWEMLKKKTVPDRQSEIGYLDNLFYLGLRSKEDQMRNRKQEEMP